MRSLLLLPFLLSACASSGQSFSAGGSDENQISDAGQLEVQTSRGGDILDFGSALTASDGTKEFFAVKNIGEGNLTVSYVRITDAGDNVGAEVFKDLQRTDGTQPETFSLSPNTDVEFSVVAVGKTAMDADGTIEIYTNDSDVNMGGPGKYLLPLKASFIGNGGDDTGSSDSGDDTGSPDSGDDTGSPDSGDDTGSSDSGDES
jgi:hypothetical protein